MSKETLDKVKAELEVENIIILLDKEIIRLELLVSTSKNKWLDFEEDLDSDDYDGAGNYFRHSDDCFEAGSEYGQWQEQSTTLKRLKEIRGGFNGMV